MWRSTLGLGISSIKGDWESSKAEAAVSLNKYHGGLEDGDAGIKGKGLAFFLLAYVDGTWKMGVYACVELSHVIVDVWLQDGCVGGLDVCDKIT